MSDNEALITQFMDVTGVARERAEFYLESSNFQLQVNFWCFCEILITHRNLLGGFIEFLRRGSSRDYR